MADTTIIDDNVSEMQKVLEELEISTDNLTSIGELRSAYATSMSSPPMADKKRADEIMDMNLHAPMFKPTVYNGESIPNHKEISIMATDIGVDTISVDHEIINTANRYTSLLSGTLSRLNAVRKRLLRNRQRIDDINFICSAYAGMKDVQPLTDNEFTGEYTYSNGTFAAKAIAMNQVRYNIDDISGNGYVGNTYVLDSLGRYEQLENDTGVISNINDNSPTTVFEYSRLVNKDNGAYTPNVQNKDMKTIVNFDNKDVECVITISTDDNTPFNTIVFSEPGEGLRITNIEISDDGVRYKDYFGDAIELNGSSYSAKNYSPGCNLVSFPLTTYAKIHLASSAISDDYGLGRDVLSIGDKPEVQIDRLANADRKVIRFGGLIAYNAIYTKSSIITDNLAPSNGCERIAIFANSYIPKDLEGISNVFKYELIVNGETHEIKPINSDEPGIKIISGSSSIYSNANTLFIDDKIKMAQLKIEFNTQNDSTPYVGNIKACIG